MAAPQFSEYFKTLDSTAQGQYTKKLTFTYCDRVETMPDPYTLPPGLWKSDPAVFFTTVPKLDPDDTDTAKEHELSCFFPNANVYR